MKPVLSIVIPVFNEAPNITLLRERLSAALNGTAFAYEVICVDDGSLDGSGELLNSLARADARWKVIHFSRNFGHQAAITAGIRQSVGDAVITMDADLQDPPEVIPELIAAWRAGNEIVYAKRRIRHGESVMKRSTAAAFYWLLSKMSRTQIPRCVGDFRLLDRKVVEALIGMKESHPFLRGMISWVGFRSKDIEFERDARYKGKTHYSLRKMAALALDGITSFSKTPLRIATYLGFLVAFFSFIAAAYTLISRFVYHTTIQGWASLMTALLFLGGIQLICLGILGEYVGRIHEEGKKRPLYIIQPNGPNSIPVLHERQRGETLVARGAQKNSPRADAEIPSATREGETA